MKHNNPTLYQERFGVDSEFNKKYSDFKKESEADRKIKSDMKKEIEKRNENARRGNGWN